MAQWYNDSTEQKRSWVRSPAQEIQESTFHAARFIGGSHRIGRQGSWQLPILRDVEVSHEPGGSLIKLFSAVIDECL